MTRRIAAFTIAVTMTLALLVYTHPIRAQQAQKVSRIGFLAPGSVTSMASLSQAFSEGLREHGWTIGRDITIEYRWADGKLDRLPDLAAELVRLRMDVIFATHTPSVVAVKKTGTTIPTVFAAVSEPIDIGAVASLAHPGGSYTGLTTINRELMPKRLALLKEVLPGLRRIGYLANPAYAIHQPQLREMQAAARSLGIEIHLFEVRQDSELESAFAGMATARMDAFIVQQDPLFLSNGRRMLDLAVAGRLPGIHIGRSFTEGGGLVSYGPQVEELFRRAADYVDRILKGAKPADLPVERPTKFEFVINRTTAKALGITIPPAILLRADKIVE